MTINMGLVDRIFRLLIAAAVFAAYWTGALAGWPLLIAATLAVVFVGTSLVGFCPLYRVFGFSTCARPQPR